MNTVTKDSFIGISRYSPYFIININYLAHKGGVKLLCDYISNTYVVAGIVAALETLNQIYLFLDENYAKEFVLTKIEQALR